MATGVTPVEEDGAREAEAEAEATRGETTMMLSPTSAVATETTAPETARGEIRLGTGRRGPETTRDAGEEGKGGMVWSEQEGTTRREGKDKTTHTHDDDIIYARDTD